VSKQSKYSPEVRDRAVRMVFERLKIDRPVCGDAHVEKLDWLMKNPRYIEHFALNVGALCRSMSNKAVAEMERLHDSTVKDLPNLCMTERVLRAGAPAPPAIRIDEIAIHKGHDYRVVVSDLERGRPIWFGGSSRTETDIELFFAEVGPKKSGKIEVAAMDMWRPFRNSAGKNAPDADIVFDNFHILQHLLDALDQVRRDD
jgi:transposase